MAKIKSLRKYLPVVFRPKAIARAFEAAVSYRTKYILEKKDKELSKEKSELIAQHEVQLRALQDKHTVELEDRDKSKQDALEQLRKEFEIRFKKQEASFFATNQDTRQLHESYNTAITQVNKWEDELTDLQTRGKHRDSRFFEETERFLQTVISYASESQIDQKEFEKTSNTLRRKIDSAFHKPRTKRLLASLDPRRLIDSTSAKEADEEQKSI